VKAHLIRGAFYLLLVLAFSITGALLAFFRPEAPAKIYQRTLTFQERVAYQRGIEEVYWRHRIWPRNRGERPEPKPSLDAAMSHAQLEKKVEDYLRDSKALEDYWQKPIAPEQLQAEMERMALNTKQPEVLRELFEALGNDPSVIAECLARPVLAEHLVADSSAHDKGERFALLRTQVSGSKFTITTSGKATYTLPEIDPCTDDTWTATSTTNAPLARYNHTAVWTGSEMIVWGYDGNTGGRYNPSTDNWAATSTTNAPIGRESHTAVWTGAEMIVWGGYNGSYLNSGGRYNPGTDSWTATNTSNAPSGRDEHTAVWNGSEMIIWGGKVFGSSFNTGGRYNPGTDTWTATSTTNAPTARAAHTAVWTGDEMIVWGGADVTSYFNTGGRYDPSTDSWTATITTNAPLARSYHTAVWTGSEMIVWGGQGGSYLNTGGRYDASTDSWTATSTTNAPAGRLFHTAVWTSSEMIVWGGQDTNSNYLNTGGRYNPGTDGWIATSTTNAPIGRAVHTAVWTGSEMIVWGGYNGSPLNTGGRYCAQSEATPTPTATAASTATATTTTTPTPTATSVATATATPTLTVTATPTATSTLAPTATPAPRATPTPRSRPTSTARPTPPTSFNTTAYRFTERDLGTAAHSATSPDTAADAYRFAASYSGAAPVAFIRFAQAGTSDQSSIRVPKTPLVFHPLAQRNAFRRDARQHPVNSVQTVSATPRMMRLLPVRRMFPFR